MLEAASIADGAYHPILVDELRTAAFALNQSENESDYEIYYRVPSKKCNYINCPIHTRVEDWVAAYRALKKKRLTLASFGGSKTR